MRAGCLALCAVAACSPPPQKQNETAITYAASFTAEAGINAVVIFPMPGDGSEPTVQEGILLDGGTFSLSSAPQYDDAEGVGFTLIGVGSVSASFFDAHVTGVGSGSAIPTASLTRGADAGVNTYYFHVNKPGEAIINVQFEYTAQRNCGGECGGTQSWTFAGPIGLGLQAVPLTYTEEKQP
jgi:hypothetical protein